MRKLVLIFTLTVLSFSLPAQEASSPPSGFSMGLTIGADILPNPNDPTKVSSWSKLGLQPDFAIGKFGVGLDLTLRFQLYPDENTPIGVYAPDWIPQNGQTIWDVYLPKIMYLRYGLRGIDPFYVKLGSIADFTLGNGLIVSDYANTKFLPSLRIFGLQAGLDGALLNFPYVGFEALTGNLARFDVVGGRLYLRPLAFLGDSLPARLQVGGTVAMDSDPYLYTSTPGSGELIYVAGADLTLPIISGEAFSLTAFGEGAREMNESLGFVTGVAGKLVGFIRYGAQVRFLQQGFIPSYFDTNYDLYRSQRYQFVKTTAPGEFVPGWLASLGFSFFKDSLGFGILMDGPFAPLPSPASGNLSAYPHLKGSFVVKEGIIGALSFDASYEKYFIGKRADFFEDLVDATDAAIGLAVHYKTGATVLTLNYAYRWNPAKNGGAGGFDISSSLSASVRF